MSNRKIDYSKTIIYKIVCNDAAISDVYVGSTTNFRARKNGHKTACNGITNKNHNLKIYKTIRDNSGWDNWTMIEMEKYPCNDGNESRARERYYYDLLNPSLNSVRPFTTEYEKIVDACEQKKRSRNKLRTDNIDLYYIRKGINDMKYNIKHYTAYNAFMSTIKNATQPTKENYIEQLEEFQKLLAEELKKPKTNVNISSSDEADNTTSDENQQTFIKN